jgi:adenosylmethionine-8-amino-7-oxononanoate aminotransferase
MAPGILSDPMTSVRRFARSPQRIKLAAVIKNCLLGRGVNDTPLLVTRADRNSYYLDDGTEIYDASGGAAVSSIGKRNKSVDKARLKVQNLGLCYVPSKSFETKFSRDLAEWMIRSTDGKMRKAVFYGSGTNKVKYPYVSSLTLQQDPKLAKRPSKS